MKLLVKKSTLCYGNENRNRELEGIKNMELRLLRTLFSDGGKRTELYKSSRTIAYYPANAIQTNGGI